MSFVLDCSAVLPWVFGDEATGETDQLLDELAAGEQALVPAIWHLEVGHVLLGAMRKKRIDQAGVETFFHDWGTWRFLSMLRLQIVRGTKLWTSHNSIVCPRMMPRILSWRCGTEFRWPLWTRNSPRLAGPPG